ncbi:hypothetical protein [Tolypothrix sp. VBCCA 56010]|uniref:hypothetical protein n=1 Tax=Tolypothrix sp. VBCCA 56010 TaxID=3137731 RepID=UPI003D7EA9EF
MGHGEWVMGHGGRGAGGAGEAGEAGGAGGEEFYPMPNAHCLLPNYRLPITQSFISFALFLSDFNLKAET